MTTNFELPGMEKPILNSKRPKGFQEYAQMKANKWVDGA